MAKCHGQRDQHDGDPDPECIDVRRGQSWMNELLTRSLFFHPSCAPFYFFLIFLCITAHCSKG